MTGRGAYARWAFALLVAEVGCTAVVDRNVTYVPCVSAGNHYVDGFDGSYQDVLDRCWSADPAQEGTTAFTAAGDLVLRPVRGRTWSQATKSGEQPLALSRRMKGDFLVVTRAEAATTFQSDHCLSNGEAAGLFARRAQPFAWATLLVRPYFDPKTPMSEACKDESSKPPGALAFADTAGFAEVKTKEVPNVGADAEAIVALCRQGDLLAYYVHGTLPAQGGWMPIHQHQVTTEPLDVGVTAAAGAIAGSNQGMEGHFTWIVFDDHSDGPIEDGCAGALERFVIPEED